VSLNLSYLWNRGKRCFQGTSKRIFIDHNINNAAAAHNISEVKNMHSKDKRLRNIMPIAPLDLPEAKDRVETDKDGLKPDSRKVKLGPGSKRWRFTWLKSEKSCKSDFFQLDDKPIITNAIIDRQNEGCWKVQIQGRFEHCDDDVAALPRGASGKTTQ
jgi:hypothetical protein